MTQWTIDQRLYDGEERPLVLAVDTNVLVYAADEHSQFYLRLQGLA